MAWMMVGWLDGFTYREVVDAADVRVGRGRIEVARDANVLRRPESLDFIG